jgi:hypothetical protein
VDFQRWVTQTILVLLGVARAHVRAPASTTDGLVRELPRGSVAESDAIHQAVRETEEETGLAIDIQRMRTQGSRQLAATVSAHHAHLFTPRSPMTSSPS